MRRNQITKDFAGRRQRVINYPISTDAITFEELYDDISDHWLEKSKRLQARRWRKIRNQAD